MENEEEIDYIRCLVVDVRVQLLDLRERASEHSKNEEWQLNEKRFFIMIIEFSLIDTHQQQQQQQKAVWMIKWR